MSMHLKATLVAIGLSATALSAQAATMSCSIGSGGSAVSYSLSHSIAAACFSGNDTNTIDANFAQFASTNWVLAQKNDDASNGDKAITFSTAPINGNQSGSWALNAFTGASQVVINLKAGNSWGAFLLDLTRPMPLSGLWSSTKDLSHASIYYKRGIQPPPPPPPPPPAVPVPASMPLLLLGLAGIGAIKRRKNS